MLSPTQRITTQFDDVSHDLNRIAELFSFNRNPSKDTQQRIIEKASLEMFKEDYLPGVGTEGFLDTIMQGIRYVISKLLGVVARATEFFQSYVGNHVAHIERLITALQKQGIATNNLMIEDINLVGYGYAKEVKGNITIPLAGFLMPVSEISSVSASALASVARVNIYTGNSTAQAISTLRTYTDKINKALSDLPVDIKPTLSNEKLRFSSETANKQFVVTYPKAETKIVVSVSAFINSFKQWKSKIANLQEFPQQIKKPLESFNNKLVSIEKIIRGRDTSSEDYQLDSLMLSELSGLLNSVTVFQSYLLENIKQNINFNLNVTQAISYKYLKKMVSISDDLAYVKFGMEESVETLPSVSLLEVNNGSDLGSDSEPTAYTEVSLDDIPSLSLDDVGVQPSLEGWKGAVLGFLVGSSAYIPGLGIITNAALSAAVNKQRQEIQNIANNIKKLAQEKTILKIHSGELDPDKLKKINNISKEEIIEAALYGAGTSYILGPFATAFTGSELESNFKKIKEETKELHELIEKAKIKAKEEGKTTGLEGYGVIPYTGDGSLYGAGRLVKLQKFAETVVEYARKAVAWLLDKINSFAEFIFRQMYNTETRVKKLNALLLTTYAIFSKSSDFKRGVAPSVLINYSSNIMRYGFLNEKGEFINEAISQRLRCLYEIAVNIDYMVGEQTVIDIVTGNKTKVSGDTDKSIAVINNFIPLLQKTFNGTGLVLFKESQSDNSLPVLEFEVDKKSTITELDLAPSTVLAIISSSAQSIVKNKATIDKLFSSIRSSSMTAKKNLAKAKLALAGKSIVSKFSDKAEIIAAKEKLAQEVKTLTAAIKLLSVITTIADNYVRAYTHIATRISKTVVGNRAKSAFGSGNESYPELESLKQTLVHAASNNGLTPQEASVVNVSGKYLKECYGLEDFYIDPKMFIDPTDRKLHTGIYLEKLATVGII